MNKCKKCGTPIEPGEVLCEECKGIVECGNANSKGNVRLTYLGGCLKKLNILDAYRCTGCGGWFHKDCIFEHFKLEIKHDYGRQAERKKIIGLIDNEYEESGSEELLYGAWLKLKRKILYGNART